MCKNIVSCLSMIFYERDVSWPREKEGVISSCNLCRIEVQPSWPNTSYISYIGECGSYYLTMWLESVFGYILETHGSNQNMKVVRETYPG